MRIAAWLRSRWPPVARVSARSLSRRPRHELVDLATDGSASVDYPDFAEKVAPRRAAGEADRGILVCGTGIGMSIAANKIDGVRAAAVHQRVRGRAMTRAHNDANVLCLGARVVGVGAADAIVEAFLDHAVRGRPPRAARRR